MLNTPTSQVRAQSQISLTTVKGKLFDRRQVQENVEQKTGQFYQVHRFPSAGVGGGIWRILVELRLKLT